jgi:hypothetical protein
VRKKRRGKMRDKKTFKRSMLVLMVMSVMIFAMTITAAAASTVTGVKQKDAYLKSVEIEWDSEYGQYYMVGISSTKNGTYTMVSSYASKSSSKSIYDLQAGKTYYVKVYRTSSDGEKIYATSSPISVVTVPDADSLTSDNIKQTAGSRKSVTFKWPKVSGATGYKIVTKSGKSKYVNTNSATVSASAGKSTYVYVYPYRKSASGYVALRSTNYAYSGSLYASPATPTNLADTEKSNLTWKPTKSSEVTVKWNYNYDYYSPDGYQAQVYSVDGKKKLAGIKSLTSRSFTISSSAVRKAITNKGFRVRVRAYKKNDGATIYGSWTAWKVVIPQAATRLSKVSSSSAKVKWSKVANVDHYVMYVSRDTGYSDSGNWTRKVLPASTTSYTIKGLTKYKDFAVYVIPVVKINGKKYNAAKSWYVYGYVY